MKYSIRHFFLLSALFFISAILMIEPSQAEPIQIVEVYPTADAEVKPYQENTEVKPYQETTEIKPTADAEVKPYQETTEMKFFQPGVDIAAQQDSFDKSLAGKWTVYIPNMAWSDRQESGNTVVDTTHVAAGSAFGMLQISKDGSYKWKNSNRTISKGKLLRIIPRSDAVQGETYWGVINDDHSQYYIRPYSDGGIALYGVNTHLYAYSLKRIN